MYGGMASITGRALKERKEGKTSLTEQRSKLAKKIDPLFSFQAQSDTFSRGVGPLFSKKSLKLIRRCEKQSDKVILDFKN